MNNLMRYFGWCFPSAPVNNPDLDIPVPEQQPPMITTVPRSSLTLEFIYPSDSKKLLMNYTGLLNSSRQDGEVYIGHCQDTQNDIHIPGLANQHCKIHWDEKENIYRICPVNGSVQYQVLKPTPMLASTTIQFDGNTLNVKIKGKNITLEFEDGVLAGQKNFYTPKDTFVTVGSLCDSTIRLDFLKSRYQFKIECKESSWILSDGDALGPSSNGTWVQVQKDSPIIDDFEYKIGNGTLKTSVINCS